MTDQQTDKIRQLNDQTRKQLFAPQCSRSFFSIVCHTQGIQSFTDDNRYKLYLAVRDFNDFDEDNDPHGEHDFGALDFNNKKVFWKIDYYDRDRKYGSEDPADPDKTCRVLGPVNTIGKSRLYTVDENHGIAV